MTYHSPGTGQLIWSVASVQNYIDSLAGSRNINEIVDDS